MTINIQKADVKAQGTGDLDLRSTLQVVEKLIVAQTTLFSRLEQLEAGTQYASLPPGTKKKIIEVKNSTMQNLDRLHNTRRNALRSLSKLGSTLFVSE